MSSFPPRGPTAPHGRSSRAAVGRGLRHVRAVRDPGPVSHPSVPSPWPGSRIICAITSCRLTSARWRSVSTMAPTHPPPARDQPPDSWNKSRLLVIQDHPQRLRGYAPPTGAASGCRSRASDPFPRSSTSRRPSASCISSTHADQRGKRHVARHLGLERCEIHVEHHDDEQEPAPRPRRHRR